MEITNVYQYLNNSEYDSFSVRSNQFILQPHQVIPKYYLLSNPNIHSLIIHYSLGSGKTSTAVFILLYNLDLYRMYKFNLQYAASSNLFFKQNAINQNVTVVGAWQTKAQFETELMRPEFNIISQDKVDALNSLLHSPILEQRREGEAKRRKIINQIDKLVKFQGYQSFFNSVFPGVSSEIYNQNIDALIREYNRGNLKISPEFIKQSENSIIVIDEMQRLYSNLGLNSYGFAVACISKIAKKHNIKIVFLSGTMINSSLGEVPDILSIISDDEKFYPRTEFCKEDTILNGVKVWRLQDEKLQVILDRFKPCFMYYNQSIRQANEKPQLIPIQKLRNSLFCVDKNGFEDLTTYSQISFSKNKLKGKGLKYDAGNDDGRDVNEGTDVKRNVKDDIKDDVKDDVKDDINDDVKDDVKVDVKDDVNDDVKRNVKDNLKHIATLHSTAHSTAPLNSSITTTASNASPSSTSSASSKSKSETKTKSKNLDDLLPKSHDYNAFKSHFKPLSAFVFPKKNLLPLEVHIGNKIIEDTDALQPMIVYSVPLQGYQARKYIDYIRNNINSSNDSIINEHESDTVTHIHDAFIPKSSTWNEHHIYESNDVLWGPFLSINRIRDYSALGYELCRLCLINGFNNEKTVVYHGKVNSFGIKQYGAILQYNGFIRYGSSPGQNSVCKSCHNPYNMHSYPLEERLKYKVCSKFQGMYYDMLTGDLDQNDRDNLTNNLYNNPNNLYGEIIDVMFVSDVAYSGISFFNTQNLVILSRVPNVSKWKQIYARIIRTRSHALLPVEKQYAKIYTMVVEFPDELKHFATLGKYTVGERYYKIRTILNVDIEEFTKKLADNSISKTLLDNPESYKPTDAEAKVLSDLYKSDIENEINLVVKRINVNNYTTIWTLETFLTRIRDATNALSYINFTPVQDTILENLLLKNKLITMFKYSRDDNMFIRINDESNGINSKHAIDVNAFSFSQVQTINLKKSNVANALALLEKETRYSNKIMLLAKILKLVNKKYSMLVDKTVFWDTMYEIGNEYYPDDEENFIKNHCRRNRNSSLFTGCYYGQEIVLKDGTSKNVNYSFPLVPGMKGLPYKFKITCLVLSDSSPFYIHVNVIKIVEGEITDKRRENKGLVCTSMNVEKLYPYFPKLDTSLHKKQYCNELLYEICELQDEHMDEKFVYTPFENG